MAVAGSVLSWNTYRTRKRTVCSLVLPNSPVRPWLAIPLGTEHTAPVPPLILKAYSTYSLYIPYVSSRWVECLRFFSIQEEESPWQIIRLKHKYDSHCNKISNFKYLHEQENNMKKKKIKALKKIWKAKPDLQVSCLFLNHPFYHPPLKSFFLWSPASTQKPFRLSQVAVIFFPLPWVSGRVTISSLLLQSKNVSFL